MFNLQGSEIIFILLLALVVLGPEKLPGAIRRFTRTYAELRKMSSGFQSELKSALDEPMKEMRETADLVKRSADPARLFDEEEAAAAAAAERERDLATRDTGDPAATAPAPAATDDDPFADPVDDPLGSAGTDSENAEPENAEPENAEPENAEPETTEPENAEPENAEPETTEPETTEPENAEPENPEPEETERGEGAA